MSNVVMVGTAVLKPSDSTHPPGPAGATAIPGTVLICHEGAVLDREGLASWLGSCSVLRGIVVVRDPARRTWRRLRTELRRVGWVRLADVFAFRAYYSLCLARRDRRWTHDTLATLRCRYPPRSDVPVLHTTDANSPDVERFLKDAQPDIVIARCKMLLHERVFTIATHGTFVLHPGICPETGTRTGVSGRSPWGIGARWA